MAQLLLCLLPVDLPPGKNPIPLSIPNSFYPRSFFPSLFPPPSSLLEVRTLPHFSPPVEAGRALCAQKKKTWNIRCSDGPLKSPRLVCPLFFFFFGSTPRSDGWLLRLWLVVALLSSATVLKLCRLIGVRIDTGGISDMNSACQSSCFD